MRLTPLRDAGVTQVFHICSLEELWLNHNPLQSIPKTIATCKRLKHLDLRGTLVSTLPDEVSGLPQLVQLDLPLEQVHSSLRAAAATGGPQAVVSLLHDHKEHKELTEALHTRLCSHTYPANADTADGAKTIRQLTADVAATLHEPARLRTVIRNTERLFPEHLSAASAPSVLAALTTLERDNARKQLSAALESKLRLVYFDQVQPEQVQVIIQIVLASVKRLEDMQFLVAHAKAVFPVDPSHVDGAAVQLGIERERQSLRGQRAQGMQALHNAVAGHCGDASPAEVTALVAALGKHVKSAAALRELASDIPQLCPADIAAAQAPRILRRFQRGAAARSGSAAGRTASR